MRKTYFVTCPFCGSNLDPGERCTCKKGGEPDERKQRKESSGNTEKKQ